MTRSCPGCRAGAERIVRNGFYRRSSDSRRVQRFRCKDCALEFSAATFSLAYRQKKRRINPALRLLLVSLGSQRRAAILLKVNRKTVARRLPMLAAQARLSLQASIRRRFGTHPCTDLQFDDLITIEHTKCKPVALGVVVEAGTRFILGLDAASAPATGRLAAISRAKYGRRPDRTRAMRDGLLYGLVPYIDPHAVFTTDEHRDYPGAIKRHFPHAVHVTHPSQRARTAGQGELKATGFDPLWDINHTLAMLRANVNRLIRKSWCTTKRIDRLIDHATLYAEFHNRVLLKSLDRDEPKAPSAG